MMSELSSVRNSEDAKEAKSRAWHAAGNIVLGAALTVGTAGTATAVHSLYELRTTQASVDPLGLDRTIGDGDGKSAATDTMPKATDIPSLDEALRENPFLDGLTITG